MTNRTPAAYRPFRRWAMRAVAALLMVPVLPAALPAETVVTWWRSNSFGMRLAVVPRPSGDYTLRIADSRRDERRLIEELFAQDAAGQSTVVRRVVRRYNPAGELLSEELYQVAPATTAATATTAAPATTAATATTDGLVRVSRRDFQPYEVRETTYDAGGGAVAGSSLSTFVEDRLVTTAYYDAAGDLTHRDEYRYLADGSLRRLRRVQADGTIRDSLFGFTDSGLADEWHGDNAGGGVLIVYDDRGRVQQRRQWVDGAAAVVLEYEYQGTAMSPRRATEQHLRTGESAVMEYDSIGRLIREERRVPERATEVTLFVYLGEGTTVASRRRIVGTTDEIWEYRYDADLTLVGERFSRNAGVVWDRDLVDGDWHEDRYRDGRVYLRVVYRDDQRIREQDIRDGEVVRTRDYAVARDE